MSNDKQKKIYVLGGPNGAGKTTATKALLPNLLECREYVNADSVAAALSPFDPDQVAISAGRILLQRIKKLSSIGKDFAFESTLASRIFIKFLNDTKIIGYEINIIYFWLRNVDIAYKRVDDRVLQGGHNVPRETILRRYHRSLYNFAYGMK